MGHLAQRDAPGLSQLKNLEYPFKVLSKFFDSTFTKGIILVPNITLRSIAGISSIVFLAGVSAACSKPSAPTPQLPSSNTNSTSNTPAGGAVLSPEEQKAASQNLDKAIEITFQTVYFDFDSHSIKPEAQESLRQLAKALQVLPAAIILVDGNTDERGSNEYNLALGQKRSNAIKDFLVSEGASSEQLQSLSDGEEKPAATGSNEEAWAKNRRAEFRRLK